MATLGDLRARILSKLDDGSVQGITNALVDAQINSTIDYYETDSFWFGENIVDLTATVGDPILSTGFPTDFGQFIEPNSLTLIEGNVRYTLVHITPLQYDTINVDGVGLPRWYTFRNDQIELLYFPDKAYIVKLFYRKTYPDLVADGESNDFTVNADRLIEYRTLADILRDFREDDVRSATYDNYAQRELIQIKKQTYNRTSTGNLVTENIVDRGRRRFYNY